MSGDIWLVCGGRTACRDAVIAGLEAAVLEFGPPELVVHGGAWGADHAAESWAKLCEIPYLGVPAKWKSLGRKAGTRRNTVLLDYLLDLSASMGAKARCIAFPTGRSVGTHHMIRKAKEAFVHTVVTVVSEDDR